MKEFVLKLKKSAIIKSISYWGMIVFLFLYTFSIPAFSGREIWNLISYFCMAGLAGFTFIYIFLYSKFIFNKWLILPAAFVLFSFLGTAVYSHDFIGKKGEIGWTTLVLMLITLYVFYYAFLVIDNRNLVTHVLIAAFFAFAFYFAIHYRNKIFSFDLSGDRIDVFFDNQNTIGFYFAIAYAFSLYCVVFHKRKLELLFLIPVFVFFGLGLFSGSRAFLISVVVGTITILFLRLRNHIFIFFITLAALIGLTIALINIPQLSFLKDQFDRTIYTIFGVGNSKVDTSTVQRAVWPGYAFFLAGKSLIFGFGVNGFKIFSGVGTYAHNNFAEVICDFGVIGFLFFNACYFIPAILSIKKKDGCAHLISILFIIYFFRSFFGVTYYSKEAYLVLALMFYLSRDYKIYDLFVRSVKTSSKRFCEVNI